MISRLYIVGTLLYRLFINKNYSFNYPFKSLVWLICAFKSHCSLMESLLLHGKRIFELQKCRNLRFRLENASGFANRFSSVSGGVVVSAQDDQKRRSFTVSYLVDSMGLPTKLAESISEEVSFKDKKNPDSVVDLLKRHGFTKSQISHMISIYPRLLIADAEKSLSPKLQLLQSKGASNSVKFQESVKKVVEMGFDPTSSKFNQALNVFYDLKEKTIEGKVDVYKRLGLTESEIWSSFKKFPYFLKFSEKKITQMFEALKKCGLLEDEVLLRLKSNPQCMRISVGKIENSIETFLELGFTKDEFRVIVMRFPQCLGLSAETLKKKTEFLVKKMNWPLKDVVVIPSTLGCSFEKRTLPRCNVIKALMAKGLLGNGGEIPPMSAVLVRSDEAFLNRFVRKHEELVPELMAIFTKPCVS